MIVHFISNFKKCEEFRLYLSTSLPTTSPSFPPSPWLGDAPVDVQWAIPRTMWTGQHIIKSSVIETSVPRHHGATTSDLSLLGRRNKLLSSLCCYGCVFVAVADLILRSTAYGTLPGTLLCSPHRHCA